MTGHLSPCLTTRSLGLHAHCNLERQTLRCVDGAFGPDLHVNHTMTGTTMAVRCRGPQNNAVRAGSSVPEGLRWIYAQSLERIVSAALVRCVAPTRHFCRSVSLRPLVRACGHASECLTTARVRRMNPVRTGLAGRARDAECGRFAKKVGCNLAHSTGLQRSLTQSITCDVRFPHSPQSVLSCFKPVHWKSGLKHVVFNLVLLRVTFIS